MTNWFKKEIGDAITALEPSIEVIKLYTALTASGQDMSNICVILKDDAERKIKTLYFTPGAGVLARLVSATPCDKPNSRESLTILAG
jgi:hypothetical protein